MYATTTTSTGNTLNSTTGGPYNHHTSTMTPRRVKRHHQRNRSSTRSRQPSHPMPENNFANNYMSGGGGDSGSVGSLAGVGGTSAVTASNANGYIPHHQRSSNRSSQRRTNRQSGRHNRRTPQYVNPVTQLMNDSSSSTDSQQKIVGMGPPMGASGRLGHSNPMYVHSRPGSLHSLVSSGEPVERPPSVHSSYSNYHGVRQLKQQNLNTSSPPVNNHLPPQSALHFGRSGKGLRGSQNSILSADQRRTALTSSEIRVPSSSNSNVNNILPTASSSSSNNNVLSNITVANSLNYNSSNNDVSSDIYHQLPQPVNSSSAATAVSTARNAASQYHPRSQYSNQLSPSSVTSITNISPASVISSSHNTTQSSSNAYSYLHQNIPMHQRQHHHNNNNYQQQQTKNNLSHHHQQHYNGYRGNTEPQYMSDQMSSPVMSAVENSSVVDDSDSRMEEERPPPYMPGAPQTSHQPLHLQQQRHQQSYNSQHYQQQHGGGGGGGVM